MQPIQFLSPDSLLAAEAEATVSQQEGVVSAQFIQELMARLGGHSEHTAGQIEDSLRGPGAERVHEEETQDQEEVEFVSLDGAEQVEASTEGLFPTGALVRGPGGQNQVLVIPKDVDTAAATSGETGRATQPTPPQVARSAVDEVIAKLPLSNRDSLQARPEVSAKSFRPLFDAAPDASPGFEAGAHALRIRLRGSAPQLDADRALRQAVAPGARPAPETAPNGEALGIDLGKLKGASTGADIRTAALAVAQQAIAHKGRSEAQVPHQPSPQNSSAGGSASQTASLAQQGPSTNGQPASDGEKGASHDSDSGEAPRFDSKSARGTAQPQAAGQSSAWQAAGRSAPGAEGSFSDALASLSGGESRAAASPEVRSAAGSQAPPQTLGGAEPEQIFKQIVRSARLFNSQEGQNFEIRLKPDFLGRIRIETVLTAENRLTTRFLVEDPEVRAMLEHRLPALADRLSDGGVRIQSVEVQSLNSSDAGRAQADAQQGQQRQSEGQETQHRSSRPSPQEEGEDSPQENMKYRPSHRGRISLVA
ncbi:MAG TPA: flagellar hook-length control protein FliK [Acidobacteriota bacterium]|nr:flagellar hook-length control protein FliK [Acidobacteriota bacterium]